MTLRILTAAGIAALALAAPAHAEGPALGEVTSVDGSSTAFAQVRVPHPVPLVSSDDHYLPRVRRSGHGRLYGVVLRQDAPGAKAPFSMMATSGDGDGDPPEHAFEQVTGESHEGPPVMPAGDYRLYVLADGKPVHAEIVLPGLEGTASVAPQIPVPQRIDALPRTDSGGPAAVFAGNGTLASKGLVIVRPHTTSDAELDRRTEVCTYG